MAALSDRSKTIGDLLEALRLFYPQYTWTSKLHSNMIRGKISTESEYTIMIIYFQMQKVFEVCIRGVEIDCRSKNKDCVEGIKEIEEQLIDKKKTIEKIIEELTNKRLEE